LKIKEILKGRHFDDIDDIRSNIIALKAIPQNQFRISIPRGSTLKMTTVIVSDEFANFIARPI
jgi:hypothetical protein